MARTPISLQAIHVAIPPVASGGERLVFLGTDPEHGQEPWASDGTTAGTRRIADLTGGAGSPRYYDDFEVIGQRLFFTATASAAQGQELYVTDGTAAGTRRLTSLSYVEAIDWLQPVALGNRLFFPGGNRKSGLELWSSDGTAKGTRLVLAACPGDCGSDPTPLFRLKGRLYYRATDGTHGYELWVTDGTAQGTHWLKDFCPGECDSWPRALSAQGDLAFFTTGDQDGLVENLWYTDGTEEGTVALPGGQDYMQGVVVGGRLFFTRA